jgi:anaerobic selenocysteine-containing dehydrogenase
MAAGGFPPYSVTCAGDDHPRDTLCVPGLNRGRRRDHNEIQREGYTMSAVIKTFHGACPHDCPDTCAFVYTVEDDRLVSVRGNPDHPLTNGGLCVKLKDYDERHYNADRLLYPLRRNGPKGSRQYVRISWESALEEIRQRWSAIIAEHGAQSILPLSYLGNQGLVHGITAGDAFFNRLGATVCEKTFCASGSSTAWLLTVGPTGGLDPESFCHAKYIVIWGCNTLSTNLHHWPFVKRAQEAGAKVVVIDAYRSLTARHADWHIAPRPGTDGALAMAWVNVLVSEGLVDRDYIDRFTVGFEDLAERASTCTPEWAEGITGIPADDIRQLAREYAATQPAAIRVGVGLERSAGGADTIRLAAILPALVGAWRHVGGGTLEMPVWEMPIHWDRVCRPDFIPEGTRVVNILQTGRALTGGLDLDPPVKGLFVYNTNPVTQAPETDRILEGLARDDLFTVVAEQFMSDTASYADIILPASLAAEAEDMVWSWGHFYLTYNQKAIEPAGESLPNAEIFRRLARVMGFGDDPQFTRSDREMIEHYVNWDAPQMQGITMATFEETGYAHLNVGSPDTRAPHRDGNFPTPSGKVEIRSSLAENGNFVAAVFRQMYEGFQGGEPVDPLPGYRPPRFGAEANPELARQFPLHIVAPKSHGFLNSCYANEAKKIRGQGDQFVLIAQADADARGIADGERVRVFNGNGQFEAVARISGDVNAGLVVATLGYWRTLNPVGTVNSVAPAIFGGLGHCPTFFDNRVEVSRLTA